MYPSNPKNRPCTTLLFFASLLLAISPSLGQHRASQPLIALLGSFDEEVKLIRQSLKNTKTKTIYGIRCTTGQLNGRNVVVAETGMGKVNAAMTTTLVITHYHPTKILFTGIAGSTNPVLQPGDIVIARKTGYHDYGILLADKQNTAPTQNPITKKFNPLFFQADSTLLRTAQETAQTVSFETIPTTSRPPSVIVGTVVTGDLFIASEQKASALQSEYNADATEMEGAAVAQICHQLQTPCLIIRSVSDKANTNAQHDMVRFLNVAARNSANLVIALLGRQL